MAHRRGFGTCAPGARAGPTPSKGRGHRRARPSEAPFTFRSSPAQVHYQTHQGRTRLHHGNLGRRCQTERATPRTSGDSDVNRPGHTKRSRPEAQERPRCHNWRTAPSSHNKWSLSRPLTCYSQAHGGPALHGSQAQDAAPDSDAPGGRSEIRESTSAPARQHRDIRPVTALGSSANPP